ncbi:MULTISPECIES: glutathione S-transferase family protein [Rhodomicrobium]|uniref:glutathione S-transferase family protein n=1 Tax=Rhodomicrobium TaxID=1068 RepID=UPI000B4BD271|nr:MULTISPECIES: glutathione S-transferase family protein [Rhodomicrobium]
MPLTLYYHPLASYCHKVLIALYENETPFTPHLVDLGDPEARAKFAALWPLAKMPVLRDEAKDRTVPESSIIIEYLEQHYPGPAPLIPADPDLARHARFGDRFFDIYVHTPMQKVVEDRLRPEGRKDPHGVEQAMAALRQAYGMIDRQMAASRWAMGESFSMADCAAAPALFYADKLLPLGGHPNAAAYFERLRQRPSFARVLREAEPYFAMFPQA